jgi:hypothetical protein
VKKSVLLRETPFAGLASLIVLVFAAFGGRESLSDAGAADIAGEAAPAMAPPFPVAAIAGNWE